MSDVMLTMIVPASKQTDARNMWIALDGPGGAGMFSREVRKTADNSIWYISSGAISEEMADCIQDPAVMATACSAVSYPLDEEGCTVLLADWIIDTRVDEEVADVLSDNGLYFPPPPTEI